MRMQADNFEKAQIIDIDVTKQTATVVLQQLCLCLYHIQSIIWLINEQTDSYKHDYGQWMNE